jgi:hypothetical protein
MPLFTPTYGGVPIFGLSVRMQEVPQENAQQIDAFFGVPGLLSKSGGPRGRVFQVEGVLFDFDIPSLNADEDVFTPNVVGNMADGLARVLTDTRGRSWANVIFLGEFQPDPMGPRVATCALGSGWALPYKAVFRGLS